MPTTYSSSCNACVFVGIRRDHLVRCSKWYMVVCRFLVESYHGRHEVTHRDRSCRHLGGKREPKKRVKLPIISTLYMHLSSICLVQVPVLRVNKLLSEDR